jgi:DNA repair protein RAD51
MQQQSKKKAKSKKQKQKEEEEEKHVDEEGELEFEGPMPIESLVEKGINEGDIKKLKEAGYNTIESILFTPMKTLILIKGLSENKIEKILTA